MPLTNKQKIGKTGENIAVKHLKNLNFKILDRNYRKKCGEIDIIAKKDNILHFIEVKSISFNLSNVSCETSNLEDKNVSRETFEGYNNVSRVSQNNVSHETIIPEENFHFWKRKRMAKTINIYLLDKKMSDSTEWQIDLLSVFIDLRIKKAKIRFLENITW